jgi:uncharacterized secreted protein with C-terminal beta-propeller domain
MKILKWITLFFLIAQASSCGLFKKDKDPATPKTASCQISGYQRGNLPTAAHNRPSGWSQETTAAQESGVDESDVVKFNKDFIFILRESDLLILERSTKQERGSLPINKENYGRVHLYATDSKLILIKPNADFKTTSVEFYGLSERAMPSLVATRTLAGIPRETRISTGQVIAIQESNSDNNVCATTTSCTCDNSTRPTTALSQILPTITSAIYSIEIESNGNRIDQFSLPDRIGPMGSEYYITKNYIFVAQRVYGFSRDFTEIEQIKVDFESGGLISVAKGTINGFLKDRWSLKYIENEGTLIAATSGITRNGPNSHTYNYLTSLSTRGQELKSTKEISGFATDETIKAVRFVKDSVYVVTFREKDPLFIFDISNPNAPTLQGELTATGFSTMLYPLADNRVFGIGFDADESGIQFGLQASLFDVSNQHAPSRIDSYVMGAVGSNSEASYNSHAFYYDSQTNIVGIPYLELAKGTRPDAYKSSGSVFFRISDCRVDEIARDTHFELMPQTCQDSLRNSTSENPSPKVDVRRILKLDGKILTISPFGLRTYHQTMSRLIEQIKFSGIGVSCPQVAD